MFIYFWDRERHSMSREGEEREGDTECEAGSRLWAVSTEPDAGFELTNCEIVTWAEVGRLTDWATQAPQFWFIFERESMSQGGAEWEGDTESEADSGSDLSAQSPTWGSNPQTVRSWPGPKSGA